MMINVKNKTAIEVKQKKNQQQKMFVGKYRKGLQLFGFDPLLMEVYRVDIQHDDIIEWNQNKNTKYKATINKGHKYCWALNLKNALRKFNLKLNPNAL